MNVLCAAIRTITITLPLQLVIILLQLQLQLQYQLQYHITEAALVPQSSSSSSTSFVAPPNNTLCKFATSSTSSVINTNHPSSSSSSSLSMSLRAWTCHGKTNRDLIENLIKAGIIKSSIVRDALLQVDRHDYTSTLSYVDAPQTIGHGQTISAPHMHAHALEELVPTLVHFSQQFQQENNDAKHNNQELKILDVGCGSGYLTAAFGRLVNRNGNGPIPPLAKGHVYGIDVIPSLVDLSRSNILLHDADLLQSNTQSQSQSNTNTNTVSLSIGNGWNGLPSHAPYHIIHVGAAAEEFPTDLMMQLVKGGVMVIPVGKEGGVQSLYRVERLRDENVEYDPCDFDIRSLLGVRYVPLVRSRSRSVHP